MRTALTVAAIGLLLAALEAETLAAESARRPNVVVILADDLGYGDLSCYGHPEFRSPRIDRMADEGVRLTQFYAPVPYCGPSRATLLTGRYTFRHGMTSNPDPQAGTDGVGIRESEILLGEILGASGYATCCIGKWHLGHYPQFYPRRHGFGEFFGMLYSNDMRPVRLWKNETIVEYPVVQATLTQRYTEAALAFIEACRDRPFFLYFPQAMPHKPLAVSESFYQKSGAGLYGDVIAELDWSVGRVLDKLTELDLDRDTLVFFTSDNGPWFGGSTGGLREMKGMPYEGGVRVPAIIRWPGRVPAGRVRHEPAVMCDIFPTTLAAAGVDVPEGHVLDGCNLLPLLRDGGPSPHEAIPVMRGTRMMGIRSGDWRLHVEAPIRPKWFAEIVAAGVDPRAPDGVTILAPREQATPSQHPGVQTGDPPEPMMLFNLVEDPAEQKNVSSQHPEVVARLTTLYEQLKSEADACLRDR